jgi:hypothetical protein
LSRVMVLGSVVFEASSDELWLSNGHALGRSSADLESSRPCVCSSHAFVCVTTFSRGTECSEAIASSLPAEAWVLAHRLELATGVRKAGWDTLAVNLADRAARTHSPVASSLMMATLSSQTSSNVQWTRDIGVAVAVDVDTKKCWSQARVQPRHRSSSRKMSRISESDWHLELPRGQTPFVTPQNYLLSINYCPSPPLTRYTRAGPHGAMSTTTLPKDEAPPSTKRAKKPRRPPVHYPFWFGGSAASMAAVVTHPLDLGS